MEKNLITKIGLGVINVLVLGVLVYVGLMIFGKPDEVADLEMWKQGTDEKEYAVYYRVGDNKRGVTMVLSDDAMKSLDGSVYSSVIVDLESKDNVNRMLSECIKDKDVGDEFQLKCQSVKAGARSILELNSIDNILGVVKQKKDDGILFSGGFVSTSADAKWLNEFFRDKRYLIDAQYAQSTEIVVSASVSLNSVTTIAVTYEYY